MCIRDRRKVVSVMELEKGMMYHIRLKKGDVGRYVLLPGDPFRTDLIATYFDEDVYKRQI